MNKITEGVILAAGQGTRLRVVSGDKPKPLVKVGEHRLIDYGVENMIKYGVERVIIVVGYEHQQVRDHLAGSPYRDRIVFVQNDEWQKENGLSVLKAGEAVESDWFYLQMVDHLFDPRVFGHVAGFPRRDGYSYLCIDKDIPGVFDLPDATVLTLADDGSIATIGKELDNYDYCDTGLFLMSKDIFRYFQQAADMGRNTISNAVELAGNAGRFFTIDCTGYQWLDVDTEDAWVEAHRRLGIDLPQRD